MAKDWKLQQAEDLLTHYFRQIHERTGLGWNSDNEAEVREIARLIYEGACDHADRNVLAIQNNLLK